MTKEFREALKVILSDGGWKELLGVAVAILWPIAAIWICYLGGAM